MLVSDKVKICVLSSYTLSEILRVATYVCESVMWSINLNKLQRMGMFVTEMLTDVIFILKP
jgi:hypothetical protein